MLVESPIPPHKVEHTLFSTQGTFYKIDHMLGYKNISIKLRK